MLDDAGFRIFENIILKSQTNVFGKEFVMNCKFHPEAEAVTTCGWCEAPMCNECVNKSFITRKMNNRPTCYLCSIERMEKDRIWLKRCVLALIIGIIVSIILIVCGVQNETDSIWWIIFLSGFFFARISMFETINEMVEEEASGDVFFKKIGEKLIVVGIFGCVFPIVLIVYFIKYLKKRGQYKYGLQYLQEYESIMPTK